jgi:RNA polymerase primary sigma factor
MNGGDKAKGTTLNPLLRMAALAGVETVVMLRIRRGDDLDARDGAGMTPLMLAASKNRSPVCALLVEAGADLGLCDPSGRDALCIALATGATASAEVLSVALGQHQPVDKPLPTDEVETPAWMKMVSLDDDWEPEELEDWEAEKVKIPPEGDASIAEKAAAIHRSISLHVPLDSAEDWRDFEALLPEVAVRPRLGEAASDDLRLLLLRTLREGAVSEKSVARLCFKDGDHHEDKERTIRALVAEIGILPNECAEEEDERFLEEPTDAEEDELAALLAYAEDLDPWRCDPAQIYHKDMRSGRLLTAEEEVVLGKEMEQGLALALKALASWPAGLDELEKAGESSYIATGHEEFVEEGDEQAPTVDEDENINEEEEGYSSGIGLANGFKELLGEVSTLRRKGCLSSVAALEGLKLAPSFLINLTGIAQGDPEAYTFKEAIERYSRARETMIVCNLRLVYGVVKRYQGLGLMLDDLLQEGNIGLVKAVERYDWRRGFKFSTYATWWIRQNAYRAVADTGRTIRLPAHLSEKVWGVSRAADAYESGYGSVPSDSVLASLVSMPVERVSMLRARMEEPKCIHQDDGDGVLWEDRLYEEPECSPDFVVERGVLGEAIKFVLKSFDKRLAEVIVLRYGLDGLEPRTLEEIGQSIGLTRERIRQIEVKALRELAHPSRSARLAQFYYSYNYSQRFKRAPKKIGSRIDVNAANNKTAGPQESSTSNKAPIEPANNTASIAVKKQTVESDHQLRKTSSQREESKVPQILRKGDRVTYLTNTAMKRAGVIAWTDGNVVKITDSGSAVSKNLEDVIAVDNPSTSLLTTN